MMNKKAGQTVTIKRMVLVLIGIIAVLTLAIVLTVGATSIDADDPVYINGKLVTAFEYNGEPRVQRRAA